MTAVTAVTAVIPLLRILVEIIQVARSGRQLTIGVPRSVRLVGSVLVSPCPDLVKVSALMRGAHSVDTDAGEDLEGCVAMAHDGLTNVVETMVAMENNILWRHGGDGFGIVCEANEVLRNEKKKLILCL